MPDITRYQYDALPKAGTIRILELDPGQPGDALTGTLTPVPIDSAGSYESLSYVWSDPGPPDVSYEIKLWHHVNGQRVLVLQGGSIFAALCRVRLPDRPRRIWADQCCINQADPVERSQQIQFMNRIYRHATNVLVWLGLDPKAEAALAFGFIRELDVAVRGRVMDHSERDRIERHVRENRRTIQALTDRPWFKRGWIVQEIGTSTPASMIWGDAVIEWETLAGVCERLKSYHDLRSTLKINTSDISFLYRRFIEPDETTHHANRFNLVYELQRARHLRFSDDRDRIFAFLGHFSTRSQHHFSCGPVSITADYSKTVEEAYMHLATQLLRTAPASACILLAAVQHTKQSLPSRGEPAGSASDKRLEEWLSDIHKLPSWVPDWRSHLSGNIMLAEPICPHFAHGNSAPNFEITEEETHSVLRVHGIQIDTIEACSQPLLAMDFYDQKASDQRPRSTIERLWQDICGKSFFNLTDPYRNGEAALFAFTQTLSNGCVQAAGHGGTPYHEIPSTVWLHKGARFVAEVASEEVSEQVAWAAERADGERDDEGWSRWASSASEGRAFAMTERGYYVLGPAVVEAGDVVCVLFGAKVPFCLRPAGRRYLLVGECYVHGLMKGEALDMLGREEVQETVFSIV